MKRLLRKFAIGTASVLALGIGGTALDYLADPGNAAMADAASMPAAMQAGNDLLPGGSFYKDDVRWAQVELRDRGLYRGSLDGVIGPETQQALSRFQQKHGLDRTASLDAQTFAALTGYSAVEEGASTPGNGGGSAANSFGTSDSGR